MIHVDEKSLQYPLVVAQTCITSSVINICKFEVKELIKGNLGGDTTPSIESFVLVFNLKLHLENIRYRRSIEPVWPR